MLPSITNIDVSGLIVDSTYNISSKSDYSYLCLPDVSTIIISYFYSLKKVTPSYAILTGSASFLCPKNGHLIFAAFIFNYSNAPALNVSAHTSPTLQPLFMY
jgi:hypothetical protein